MIKWYSSRNRIMIPPKYPIIPTYLKNIRFTEMHIDLFHKRLQTLELQHKLQDKVDIKKQKAGILMLLCPYYATDTSTNTSSPSTHNTEREVKYGFLMTQRQISLRKHAGEISFPGGLKEPSDISLEQTALRETNEECPFIIKNGYWVEVLGLVSQRVDKSGRIECFGYLGVLRGMTGGGQVLEETFFESDSSSGTGSSGGSGSGSLGSSGQLWNKDEVESVFILNLNHLLNEAYIRPHQLRHDWVIPSWRGPVLTNQNTSLQKTKEEHKEKDGSSLGSSSELNVWEEDGKKYMRIWGLSAVFLCDFLNFVVLPVFSEYKI